MSAAIRKEADEIGKWLPVGQWSMVKGEKTVAKYITNGQAIYVRFDGDQRVGQYASFAEAQQERKAA